MEQTENVVSSRYDKPDNSFNTIRLRLDPSDLLFDLEKYFLKITFDPQLQTWGRPANLKPMFDEQGVYELLGELKRISTSSILGNLPEDRLKGILKDTGEAVIEFLAENEGKYNITSDLWIRIYYQCVNQVEMGLRRSVNGFESKQLVEGHTTREVMSGNKAITEAEQSKGFLNKFGGR